ETRGTFRDAKRCDGSLSSGHDSAPGRPRARGRTHREAPTSTRSALRSAPIEPFVGEAGGTGIDRVVPQVHRHLRDAPTPGRGRCARGGQGNLFTAPHQRKVGGGRGGPAQSGGAEQPTDRSPRGPVTPVHGGAEPLLPRGVLRLHTEYRPSGIGGRGTATPAPQLRLHGAGDRH